MNTITPANAMPAKRTYKFPAAAELVNAMLSNLSANNASPDAIDAVKTARELANTPTAKTGPSLKTR